MFKKIFYGVVAISALYHTQVGAQGTTNRFGYAPMDSNTTTCNISTTYFASNQISAGTGVPGVVAPVSAIVAPSSFPSTAIKSCGKFSIYYEDIRLGYADGFADASTGVARQNLLCSVLTYIQSVFDFSNVPNGALKLFVDRSYTTSFPSSGSWSGIAKASPYFPAVMSAGSTQDGFLHDFVVVPPYNDPNPTGYHATLQVSFEYSSLLYVGTGTPGKCQVDLYSVLLHEMGHAMGWLSWVNLGTTSLVSTGTGQFSSLDRSISYTPDPSTTPSPFASIQPIVSGTSLASPSVSSSFFWVNGLQPPYNYATDAGDFLIPGSGFNHLTRSNYGGLCRLSPGDNQEPVMHPVVSHNRRIYAKADWETFHNAIGYQYNPAFATAHAAEIANHTPYSSKMQSYAISSHYYTGNYRAIADNLPADYTLTNDLPSTTLTINLNSLTDLKDADGDLISVYPGSLVNFRGCGSGGNNHNLLTLSNSDRTITYTLRHNFYGRAQFGFNLYDGVEKGAFVIFTVDVAKGTNVAVPKGQNMVLNGGFEEGSEVKISGNETVNNSMVDAEDGVAAYRMDAIQYSDAQPFDYYMGGVNGTAISNSFIDCSVSTSGSTYGSNWATFPIGSTSIPYYYPPSLPPSSGVNNRYRPFAAPGGLYYLGEQMQSCHRYVLEFDAVHVYSSSITYPATDQISVGFTDDAHVVDPAISAPASTFTDLSGTTLLYSLSPKPAATLGTTWGHVRIPFTYCGTSPSNVLYLDITGVDFSNPFLVPAPQIVDNITLTETDLSATATATMKDPCTYTLDVPDNNYSYGCGSSGTLSYTWTTSAGVFVSNARTVDVFPPYGPTTYNVSVSDGCNIATGSVTINSTCVCSPPVLMGSGVTYLSGTIPATITSGSYYIPNNITISSNTTMTGANILIAPNVTITVANNVKLTLDGCHLFTCPTDNKMWQGIVLASGGTTSGRIEVTNNSMIEDAQIAISANNPKIPSSGDIIHSFNSVYNRNQLDVQVQNLNVSVPATYPIYLINNVFTSRLFNSSTFSGYPASWPTAAALKTHLSPNSAKASYALNRNYARAKAKDGNMSYMSLEFDYVGLTTGAGASFSEVVVGGGLTTDSFNLFDDKKYGIYSNRSNVTVHNSVFMNMSRRWDTSSLAASVLPDWGGIGIFARSDSFRYDRLQVTPINYSLADTFFDCFDGIGIDGVAEVNVTNSFFTSSHVYGQIAPGAAYPTDINTGRGIWMAGNKSQAKWNVSSNVFCNVNTGITGSMNRPIAGATTHFDNNQMYATNQLAGYTSYLSGQYMMIGIDIYGTFTTGNANTVSVSGNNPMSNLYNGISINGFRASTNTVNSNIITLLDKTSTSPMTQTGINILSTNNATVSSNNISTGGLGAPANANRIYGINTSFSNNVTLCTNTTLNMGSAFGFTQKTPQAAIRWVLNSMTNSYRGMVLGSDIGGQSTMTDYSGPFARVYMSAAGNLWNGGWVGRFQTWETDSVLTTNSILYVHSTGTEQPTLNGSSKFAPPLNMYYNTTGGSIINPLIQTPAATCNGGLYPTRVTLTHLGTGAIGMMALQDSLGYGVGFNPNQWMAQLALYELNATDSTLVDSSAEYKVFIDSAANSRFAWIAGIEAALDNEDAATAQTLLNSPVAAMGRVSTGNLGVVITDYPEADYVVDNYTQYFQAYIDYLNGTFTSGDQDIIDALANGCPARDGAVVYKARAFNSILTHNYTEYNDEGCLYGNPATYRMGDSVASVVSENYTLYPNPNNGTFEIRQNNVQNKQVQMKVYNSLGAVIYQTSANFTGGKVQVSFGQPAAGMYMICLDDGSDKLNCLPFVIK